MKLKTKGWFNNCLDTAEAELVTWRTRSKKLGKLHLGNVKKHGGWSEKVSILLIGAPEKEERENRDRGSI